MKKIILAILFVFLLVGTGFAQERPVASALCELVDSSYELGAVGASCVKWKNTVYKKLIQDFPHDLAYKTARLAYGACILGTVGDFAAKEELKIRIRNEITF